MPVPLVALLAPVLPALLWLAGTAQACPSPEPPGESLGGDGTAWVIVRDEGHACLLAVDEDGDTQIAARWRLRGEGAPAGVVALHDGRAVLARPDGARWRLSTWTPLGVETPLDVWLPGAPDALLAHASRGLVGVRMRRPDGRARAWLVDVDAGAIAAMGGVGPDATMAFPSDAPVLHVGDRVLYAPGSGTPSWDDVSNGER